MRHNQSRVVALGKGVAVLAMVVTSAVPVKVTRGGKKPLLLLFTSSWEKHGDC